MLLIIKFRLYTYCLMYQIRFSIMYETREKYLHASQTNPLLNLLEVMITLDHPRERKGCAAYG